MEMDEALVSFDVTSLFTNVSKDEAVEVIHKKLVEEEDLVERTPLSPERIAELLHLSSPTSATMVSSTCRGREQPCCLCSG